MNEQDKRYWEAVRIIKRLMLAKLPHHPDWYEGIEVDAEVEAENFLSGIDES